MKKTKLIILMIILTTSLMGCQTATPAKVDTQKVKTNTVTPTPKVKTEVPRVVPKVTQPVVKPKFLTKQEYLNKLNAITVSFAHVFDKAVSTVDIEAVGNIMYTKWDVALNEIYNTLKKQLSISDMKNLQHKEIQWMANRDAVAKKAAAQYVGGTAAPVAYISALTDTTKNRCYELVEKYMQ